jgi:hypothetical protein
MQRVAVLLSLAIIGVINACSPVAQQAAPPSQVAQQPAADVAKLLLLAPQSNGCTPGAPQSFIAGKVQVLAATPDATFENNFGGYDPHYRGPSPAGAPPANESDLLRRAFELAPPWLQFQLCNQVNFVFVDPNQYPGNAEFGWAFWESSDPAQSQNGKNHSLARFIGISRAALEDKNLTLSQSETHIVQSLLPNTAVSPVRVSARITRGYMGDAQETDSAAWAVLGILAHEMGHMFWHDVCDGDSNQRDQRRCYAHFHRYGWQNVGDHWTLRTFGQRIPAASQLRADFVAGVERGRISPAALQRLYTGSDGPVRWANLFATVAPDEDIAETYKYLALTDAVDPHRPRVTSLIVQGDSWTGDVVANLGRSDLCAKVQFIRTSLLQPALPCAH